MSTSSGITNASHVHASPSSLSIGSPCLSCSVLSHLPTVGEKLAYATTLDPLETVKVTTPSLGLHLSSTCIEVLGTISGKACRVLLDSGATANFVGSIFAVDLALPSSKLSQLVIVNLADCRNTVVNSSFHIDLAMGSLQAPVTCIPTVLAHYDVILGKP